MKTLKLKNMDLNIIGKALNYPMKFQQGRVKNRFIKLLADKAELMEKSRQEMLKELCKKGEDGNPIQDKGQYTFTPENQKKFGEEYSKLVNEEVLIDVLPSFEPDLPVVKQMLNNSQVELEAFEVETIERTLEALEETAPKVEKKSKSK